MKMRMGVVLLTAGTLLSTANPALAQGRGAVELGVDAALVLQLPQELGIALFDDQVEDITAVTWPLPFIRVGYYLTDRAEIELRTNLDYVKVGDFNATTFRIDAAYGYHFGPADGTRYFVGAGGGIDFFSENAHPFGQGAVTGSVARFGVGVGVGAKIPVVPQLAVRPEVDYSYDFEKEADFLPAQHNIVVRVGLSYFTR
jgi:opacity protein-like surface antigen